MAVWVINRGMMCPNLTVILEMLWPLISSNPFPLTLAPGKFFSTMNFTISDTEDKWNQTIYTTVWWGCFKNNIHQAHSYYYTSQNLYLWKGWVICHSLDISCYSIQSSSDDYLSCLYISTVGNNTAMNTGMPIYLWFQFLWINNQKWDY